MKETAERTGGIALRRPKKKGEYALSGVDYTEIEGFKRTMQEVGSRTLEFPRFRRDMIVSPHGHGVSWKYVGPHPHTPSATKEGLGNQDLITTWMDILVPKSDRSWWSNVAYNTMMMGVGDNIAIGARPIVALDEIAAGRDSWFSEDSLRNAAIAEGFFRACRDSGMALGAGESPAYRYLVNPYRDLPEHLPEELRLAGAPAMSCTIIGLIVPEDQQVDDGQIRAGDIIIGVRSSGIHANGISLVLSRSYELRDGLLTDIGDGRIYGEEAIIPVRCYVNLVEAILDANIKVHAFLPITGSAVAKFAFDHRELTYEITDWLPRDELPPLFQYLWNLGVNYEDMLTTFNMGIGYGIFAPEGAVADILRVGEEAGYELSVVGRVKRGKRQTIFHPKGYDEIILPPPGE
jgi:phosphoribosylformylglycinamidine cyclo-ligase